MGMKITDVRTYVLEAALAEPFAYSQAWYERRGALLVEILGEDGLSGWGEAFGPPRLPAPVLVFYKPVLVGADARTAASRGAARSRKRLEGSASEEPMVCRL